MGAVEDLGSQALQLTGLTGINMSFINQIILILAVMFVVGVSVGIGTYFLIQSFKLDQKIIVFEKINGRWQNTKKYRGMFAYKNGNSIFLIPKLKRIEPRPHTQTGIKTWWYFIDNNGEMVNFGLGDLDKLRAEIQPDIPFIELAYAKSSLDYDRKERYEDQSWLSKNWPLLVSIGVIVILLVFMYLIVGKIFESIGTLEAVAKTNQEVMEVIKQVLGNVDTIKSGGSGLVKAATT